MNFLELSSFMFQNICLPNRRMTTTFSVPFSLFRAHFAFLYSISIDQGLHALRLLPANCWLFYVLLYSCFDWIFNGSKLNNDHLEIWARSKQSRRRWEKAWIPEWKSNMFLLSESTSGYPNSRRELPAISSIQQISIGTNSSSKAIHEIITGGGFHHEAGLEPLT